MHPAALFTWKEAPFLRLIIPFIMGIVTQYYSQLHAFAGWTMALFSCITLMTLARMPIAIRFKYQWVNGIAIIILLFATGFLITFYKDTRNHPKGISNLQDKPTALIITIQEPLSKKTNSWKTTATIESAVVNNTLQTTTGTLLIYFQKDSSMERIHYGDRLVFTKPLLPVKNSGNPGAFDYRQYCARQGIHHQVYLKHGDFSLLTPSYSPWFSRKTLYKSLFSTREKIVDLLKKYIPGNKECGLAEALLIGYKDDLDKDLVQSYSNTGVVHVIAISGLHLGLVYLLLTFICKLLGNRTAARWIKPIMIIAGLWLFSLLAGGSPSVLRSAVMFTCLAFGDALSRSTSIYNSLAASAFLLLCYQPAWLWDVGFQLSYAAVLSIAIFQRPIYHSIFVQHKLSDLVWKLTAATIAAQVLTLPLGLYHFHQFPTLFLVTNLLAVPLSSLILLGELLLCAISFIPFLASAIGWLLHWLIWLLNTFIEKTGLLPFATINNIQLHLSQAFLLYGCIAAIAVWLFQQQKAALFASLAMMLAFTSIHSFARWQSLQQQKLIVYHVPQHQAIDFIDGNNYFFKGDTSLLTDQRLQTFHLQPSRTLHRTSRKDHLINLLAKGPLLQFGNKTILLIDSASRFANRKPGNTDAADKPATPGITVDLIILSKNPVIPIDQLATLFTCKQLVIDGSNAPWKVARWQQDCVRLGIACHSTAEQGAFVLNGY